MASTVIKRIRFVRHGESEQNVDDIQRGEHATLTAQGRYESELVAKRVRNLGIEALLTSTMARAIGTAEVISNWTGLPVEQSVLFVERRRPKVLQGRRFDDPSTQHIRSILDDLNPQTGGRYADEETLGDLDARVQQAFVHLLAHPAENICVVSHNHFLRAVKCFVKSGKVTWFDFRESYDTDNLANAAIVSVFYQQKYRDEKLILKMECWNDTSHLEGMKN